jgi:hypothetical protein
VQPPTLAGIADCRRVFKHLCTRSAPFGFFTVIDPAAGTSMSAEARTALAAVLREYENNITAATIVLEATGFTASIVRSVVSAIHFALRPKYAFKIHTDTWTAAQWLQPRLASDSRLSAAALVDAIHRRRGISVARAASS